MLAMIERERERLSYCFCTSESERLTANEWSPCVVSQLTSHYCSRMSPLLSCSASTAACHCSPTLHVTTVLYCMLFFSHLHVTTVYRCMSPLFTAAYHCSQSLHVPTAHHCTSLLFAAACHCFPPVHSSAVHSCMLLFSVAACHCCSPVHVTALRLCMSVLYPVSCCCCSPLHVTDVHCGMSLLSTAVASCCPQHLHYFSHKEPKWGYNLPQGLILAHSTWKYGLVKTNKNCCWRKTML